jgi:hypothetical protein
MLPESLSELTRLVEEGIEKHKLTASRDAVLQAAQPCILLYQSRGPTTLGDVFEKMRELDPTISAEPLQDLSEEYNAHLSKTLPLGASRIGGLPDLSPSVPWPEQEGKLIPFVAQLDLGAIPTFEGSPLPSEGWLYVFAGGPDFPLAVTGLFHAGPRETLVRHKRPADDRMLADWSGETVYSLVPLAEGRLGVSLFPGDDHPIWGELSGDDFNRLFALAASVNPREPGDDHGRMAGQLLGYLNFPEGSANDPVRYGEMEGDDWMLLLEVESVGSMIWSDCGTLDVFVRRSDLQNRDLSTLYAGIYSS